MPEETILLNERGEGSNAPGWRSTYFHRVMLIGKLRPAGARCRAHLAIGKERCWSRPDCPAAFILHGEWS